MIHLDNSIVGQDEHFPRGNEPILWRRMQKKKEDHHHHSKAFKIHREHIDAYVIFCRQGDDTAFGEFGVAIT